MPFNVKEGIGTLNVPFIALFNIIYYI